LKVRVADFTTGWLEILVPSLSCRSHRAMRFVAIRKLLSR